MALEPIYVSAVTAIVLILAGLCTITDIHSRRIPNEFLAVGLGLALIFATYADGLSGMAFSLLGLLVGMLILLPFYLLGGTGAGDVKLLGVVGALLGPQGALFAGLATLICGGFLGIAWLCWRILDSWAAASNGRYSRAKQAGINFLHLSIPVVPDRDTSLPYAPAVAMGTLATIWLAGVTVPGLG